MWLDVDAAITIPVNIAQLINDADFKTIDETIAFNESGMDLNWNFIATDGTITQTNVTPTSAGDYDWTHVGNGMYKIEMTASGGASANNDTEGFGWFSGVCDAVLPWVGPVIGFRAAALNNALIDGGDNLDVNVTQYSGTNVGAPDTAGFPKVTIKDGTGTGEIALTSGKIDGVALVDTTTANADMVGTDSAALATALTTHDNKLAPVALDGGGATIGGMLTKLADDNGGADYDATTDSQEAIRNRGDAAWITGGGAGITDILNVMPLIPTSIDLANTATVRLALRLINSLDDLPSTAEITPGTISIERKAIGGTSWTAIETDSACSEIAGQIYFDEVFDTGAGYVEGDSIRITFKSQKITVSANDYEIFGATGAMFHTEIRQTMRGTNSALLAANVNVSGGVVEGNLVEMGGAAQSATDLKDFADAGYDPGTNKVEGVKLVDTTTTNTDMVTEPPTAVENRQEMDSNSTQLSAIVGDTNEMQGKLPTNNIMGSSVKADKDDEIDAIKANTDNLPSGIKKNTALANFEFFMVDSTDDISGKTGLTVTTQRSIDGGAFSSATNSASEVAAGIYKINLSAADLNGDVITFKFSAAGANDTLITIVTDT